jgi:gliding motility-associated-like protein
MKALLIIFSLFISIGSAAQYCTSSALSYKRGKLIRAGYGDYGIYQSQIDDSFDIGAYLNYPGARISNPNLTGSLYSDYTWLDTVTTNNPPLFKLYKDSCSAYSYYSIVNAVNLNFGINNDYYTELDNYYNNFGYTSNDHYKYYGLKIFIDFNQNGSFYDTDETFYTSPPFQIGVGFNNGALLGLTVGKNIGYWYLPPTTLTGFTRMRVVLQELDSTATSAFAPTTANPAIIDPCGTYLYGETEDYPIYITDTITECTCKTLNPGSIQAASTNICNNDSLVLSAQGSTQALGLTYQWLQSYDGTNYFDIGNATDTIYTIAPNTGSAYYQLAIYCANSGAGDTTVPVFINVSGGESYNTTTICAGQLYLGHSASGNYTDTLSSASGCDSIVHTTLTVASTNTLNIAASICAGQNLFGYNAAGLFTDTFTNTIGCDSIRILNLTINAIDSLVITQSICAGQSLYGYNTAGIFTDTFTNILGCDSVRILQLNINGVSSTLSNKIICQGQSYLGYTNSGVYTDTFASVNGCDSVHTLYLNVVQPAVIISASATNVCPNSSVTLNASGANTYTWQPSNTYGGTYMGIVQNTTTYTVLGTDVQACTSSSTIAINVYNVAPLVIQPNSATLCADSSIAIQAIGAVNYNWQPTAGLSNAAVANPVASPTQNTVYTLSTSDVHQCASSATLAINVQWPEVQINNASNSNVFCEGDTVVLSANGSSLMAWAWLPATSLGSNKPVYRNVFNTSTLVQLTATDSFNCVSKDSIYLQLKACCQVLLPNAFSPNKDGNNELFFIMNPSDIQLIELKIYNRYGENVFNTKDIMQAWDGYYNGLALGIGTYYYTIRYKCNGEQVIKGSVELLR